MARSNHSFEQQALQEKEGVPCDKAFPLCLLLSRIKQGDRKAGQGYPGFHSVKFCQVSIYHNLIPIILR